LGAEAILKQPHVAIDRTDVERQVDVRVAEVAIRLHDLGFEDEVVAEGVVVSSDTNR